MCLSTEGKLKIISAQNFEFEFFLPCYLASGVSDQKLNVLFLFLFFFFVGDLSFVFFPPLYGNL